MRDEDRKLLKVYHGTAHDFNVKDKSLAEIFVDAIKNLVEKIKAFVTARKHANTEYGKALLEVADDLYDQIQQLWNEAVESGLEAAHTQTAENKKAADMGGVRLSTRQEISKMDIPWDSNNNSSIKEQVNANIEILSKISVVKELSFDKNKGDYVQQLNAVLKNWGYNINRQDGISFLFDKEAIGVLRHYVHNDEEAAAAIIAPYVLKRGKIISGHMNHKGEGSVSITIAAPVIINNQLGYEGIAVKFEKKGRVHALRILDPNGNQFIFYEQKKTKSFTNGEGSAEPESDLPSNFSSNNKLPQSRAKSNTPTQKNSDRFAEIDRDYLSAVERGDMETAKKMVDEAAERAFKNSKVRDEEIDVFLSAGEQCSPLLTTNHSPLTTLNCTRFGGCKYICVSPGSAKTASGDFIVVRSLVNRSTNEVMSIDVLYSLNTKTEPVGSLSPGAYANARYLTGSNISIADLLDYVNQYFPDILPESVLKHYGYESRPEGKIGESALFQDRDYFVEPEDYGDLFDDLFTDDGDLSFGEEADTRRAESIIEKMIEHDAESAYLSAVERF